MSTVDWHFVGGFAAGVVVGAMLTLWFVGWRFYGDWLWWIRYGRLF